MSVNADTLLGRRACCLGRRSRRRGIDKLMSLSPTSFRLTDVTQVARRGPHLFHCLSLISMLISGASRNRSRRNTAGFLSLAAGVVRVAVVISVSPAVCLFALRQMKTAELICFVQYTQEPYEFAARILRRIVN